MQLEKKGTLLRALRRGESPESLADFGSKRLLLILRGGGHGSGGGGGASEAKVGGGRGSGGGGGGAGADGDCRGSNCRGGGGVEHEKRLEHNEASSHRTLFK